MVNGSVFCKLLMVKHLSSVGAVDYPFKAGVDDAELCNSFKISVLQNGVTLAVSAKPSHKRIWWFYSQKILNSQM